MDQVVDRAIRPFVETEAPLVSVLMITYNHERCIAAAIEGVLSQKTNFSFELLIGEDCSTDGTREIADDYQRRHPDRIRVFSSETNLGWRQNFRRIRDAAHGTFIALCEGDDYWTSADKLQNQVDILNAMNDIDLCFHSCMQQIDVSPELRGPALVFDRRSRRVSAAEVIASGGGGIPTASIVVRRSVFDALPDWFFTDAPIGDFFIQCYGARRGGAYYINRPMSVYRVGQQSSWSASMKDAGKRLVFERSFSRSLDLMERDFFGQKRVFDQFIVSHYSGRCYLGVLTKDREFISGILDLLTRRALKLGWRHRFKLALLRIRPTRSMLAWGHIGGAYGRRLLTRIRETVSPPQN